MEILKKSFANFRTKSLDDNINFEEFIKKSGIILPPLYKAFVQSFICSMDNTIIPERVLINGYKDYLGYVYYLPDIERLGVGDFFSLEESLSVRAKLYDLNDEIFLKKLFPIGTDASGHFILMVGYGENNQDKIFVESGDQSFVANERFTLIANDIFEFVRGFAFILLDDLTINVNQLYRNWGEDFWRVREEGQDSSSSEHSVK